MSTLDDIQARCKANAGKLREDIGERARVERTRWKPLTAAQEPRVAPNWAKKKHGNTPAGYETLPEREAEWRK